MKNLKKYYGPFALILGASEGLGAAFAEYLGSHGMNVVLVARRETVLNELATKLRQSYGVEVIIIKQDLADPTAINLIAAELMDVEIGLVVHNATVSFIGPFEKNSFEDHSRLIQVNTLSLMASLHEFGMPMLERKKGGFIIMSSLAGFQGSGYLASYAASKAFARVLAEGLWYEWKAKGVDIIACCAGATATPNYFKTQPSKTSFFAPRVQKPEDVVTECFIKLGKKPSLITGRGNRVAHFLMSKIFGTKVAVKIMGDNTREMYQISD